MDKIQIRFLKSLPLIAILRGIRPEECIDIGCELFEIGFRIIEIPLNSPDAFKSIEKLVLKLKDKALIGGGTITNIKQLQLLSDVGGKLAVMPHTDLKLIRKAKILNFVCFPGVASPSEALAALNSGADGLKVFPAELITPKVLKSWKAILPEKTMLFPVGGIIPESMESYILAGATGFGLGSALYRPGQSVLDVGLMGKIFIKNWKLLNLSLNQVT
jgi:2-dehydro-3-deoxyphosphogalactonate aldolase|tara:strand:- start:309 stop:959 length:651 start_codon:yes stop_codon:yes gene_type:complete